MLMKGKVEMKIKKRIQFTHSRFWVSLFLCLCLLVTLAPSFFMYANEPYLKGIDDMEVEEGTQIDLLENVSAYDMENKSLEVEVISVICETDNSFIYDNSNLLVVGEAGSEYVVEYLANSPSDETVSYRASRKITSVKSINTDTIPEIEENMQSEDFKEEENEVNGNTDSEGNSIIYDGKFHYIEDPQYPGEQIILYCMNNKLNWPHHTEGMGETQVPNYVNGYLGPEDFNSMRDYEECMRSLSKLLYAGYPYNGERLYQIVENSDQYAPSEEEFNDMLIVPPVLQTAFPYLGHHAFTYEDWVNHNQQHLEELRQFVDAVLKLNIYGGTTSNGLTFEDISSMPFYKAVFSIVNCNANTPLETFQYFYGASYFVTEEEAYNATQLAVWHLLWQYGIPDNNISNLDSPLSQIFYTYSKRGGLLNYRPDSSEIKVSGDLNFTYNPKDGLWHSGILRIIEPDEYRGLYRLNLPKGITALCDNLNYVYGNEEYELVSDHQPELGEAFQIVADFVWLQDFKQYSPMPDIEFEGKKFQHMIGAIIQQESLHINIPITAENVGDVSITKKVVGEVNSSKEFGFELKLLNHSMLNGLYGDLEFHNGIAVFTLKDGETKIAKNLPAGAYYVVKESKTQGYQIGSTNSQGTVPVADVQLITFTNVKLHDLTISKTVAGAMGNKQKSFTFDIQLKNQNDQDVEGIYDYVGSVKEGFEQEAMKPEDGKVEFKDGHAEITLLHGQQITIQNLPPDTHYTITEKEANQDGYTTTYNNDIKAAHGIVNQDVEVHVVNTKEYVPDMGVKNNSTGGLGLGIMAISVLSFSILYLLRLKKDLNKGIRR